MIYDWGDTLKDEPRFRHKQVREAVFGKMVSDWDEVSNLPRELKEKLKQKAPLEIQGEVQESESSNTAKAVIFLADQERVETVLMKHKDRNTVCVSTQIGCSLGCDFCLTGRSGLVRNLRAEEIVSQVLFFARRLKEAGEQVTNVVFMGMGEAFLNYAEVMKAVRILNQDMGLGARKISISTVGIVEGIKKLAGEPEQVNLAVSLHAPDNELRNKLMPVNKKYPLEKLLPAIRGYIEKTNRKVMIEYLMLQGVNDSPNQAREFAELLQKNLPSLFMVNLISYNPTERYGSSSASAIGKFKEILQQEYKIDTVQRYKFGRDIKGACGQLASH
ncbi:MAG TPA: 23S rRNA (adenine(2503)-C(2))-methyltransferase RlmN [Patescibacteria group bacterium]|nr:23S rRNA (adenine(2503)-C(2))-methyltransferase RlmN [Patescibacteria group bacterium]